MPIRFAFEQEKEQIKTLWRYAFTDTESFCDYFFEKRYDVRYNIVAEENGKVHASLLMNPYSFRHGRLEGISRYIVGISVFPEYRGKKYTTSMLQASFRRSYENGESLSLLMPIDTGIYRRYGYENCFDMEILTMELTKIPKPKVSRRYDVVRLESPEEPQIADLQSVYQDASAQWDNYVLRDRDYFATLYGEVKEEQGEILIAYDEAKRPKGYMIFYPKYELGVLGFVREILVSESGVYDCFLRIIQSHATQMKKVMIHQPENSLLMRYLGEDNSIHRERKPFLMARILNVNIVLESLDLPKHGSICLRIVDPMIEENNGSFEISDTGVRRLEEQTDEAIDLSIGELTLLYMGRVSPSELSFLKGFEYRAETLQMMRRLFPPKISYINDYI